MKNFKSELLRAIVSALVAFLTALGASSCVFDNQVSSSTTPTYEQPAV